MSDKCPLCGRKFASWHDLYPVCCDHCDPVAEIKELRAQVETLTQDAAIAKLKLHSLLRQEILDRMTHFYLQTNGQMKFPNSAEGDLLRLVHRYLTATE